MGKKDPHLTALINHLFFGARVHSTDDGVWDNCEFLWIDGSLFYRAFDWASLGTEWRHYTEAVCEALAKLIARCPRLRVVVYAIDKYGYPTIPALPKEPTQAHRYAGAQPVPFPAATYQLDQPVLNITSTNTFGDMRARMAFNAMVSGQIAETLAKAVHDENTALELAILDGAVSRRIVPEGPQPGDFAVGDGAPENEVWRPYTRIIGHTEPMPTELVCRHSEGDISVSFWLPQFMHLNSVVHSSDVDLQQVTLQIVRRLVDAGKRPEELPSIHLFKRYVIKAGPQEHTFDMKKYFQIVCSVIQPLLAPTDWSHPVDVWAALTAISGNDFCAPWLCSEQCRTGEKQGNDGIRFESVWTAFVQSARQCAPLMMPVTQADLHSRPWSSLQLPTYVYPVELRVAAWHALMDEACALQQQRLKSLKIAGNAVLMRNKPYVQAQLRRMAWAVSYYANAAVLGDELPRGLETDAAGNSIHGWSLRGTATEMSNRVSITAETVCGVAARYAPTRPPSPDPSQMETDEQLLARYVNV